MSNGEWHVDKHIPIALVLAIIAQTGGAFWWASAVSTRMDGYERRIGLAEAQQAETVRVLNSLQVVLAEIRTEIAIRRRDGTAP